MANLLKYVGSKDKLLPEILPYIPKGSTIVEPFCGSASLSLSQDNPYYLSDSSPELINFLQCVKDDPEELIKHVELWMIRCKEFVDDDSHTYGRKEYYMTLRQTDRHEDFLKSNRFLRAARYYFIIYHGFNGLYRVNKKGFCNTPYGGDNRKLPEDWCNRIKEASKHLKLNCRGINEQQFDNIDLLISLHDSGVKLFIFIDPPYDQTFDQYTKEGVDAEFWDRLLDYLERLDAAGISFLMTNSCTDFILEKFKQFYIDKVETKYTISANGVRKSTFESFISNNKRS